jgi:TetR/AcrR family transcriptional repressor of mexJK operon
VARDTGKSEAQRRRKHESILASAAELFASNGYAATKVADVALAAQVSFGTVFTYFESKEELYRQALLESLDRMKQLFLHVEDMGDPGATIRAMIRSHIEFIARNAVFLRMTQQVIAQKSLFPGLFEQLDAFHQEFKGTLRPFIAKGQQAGALTEGDPDLVATAYLSFLVGLRLAHPDAPDERMWDAMGPMAYRLFGPT